MKRVCTMSMAVLVAGGAMAGIKPLQISLTPDIALYDRTENIKGVCLSAWGENPQTVLALGIVNGSTGESKGLSWGVALNYADNYTGIQWAPINYTKGDFLGWQCGFVNGTGGTLKGIQTGVVNFASRLTGLQFGVVNYAETNDTGMQIGLINLIPANDWFTGLPNELAPGMVFINWRF